MELRRLKNSISHLEFRQQQLDQQRENDADVVSVVAGEKCVRDAESDVGRSVVSGENSAVIEVTCVCARENDEDGVDGWLSMRSEVW